jgi:membrane protein
VNKQLDGEFRAVRKEVWQELRDDRLSNGAAIVAFYMMLALFPTAIFGLSSLRYLPIPSLQQTMFDSLPQVLPGTAAELFKHTMQGILSTRHTGLLSFGLLFAIVSGSTGLVALMQQLNAVYGVTEHRSFGMTRLISVLLLALFFVLLVMTFGLVIFGGVLHDWLAHQLGWTPLLGMIFSGFRWLVILFFLLASFAIVYRWGPDVGGPLRLFTAGNLCATFGLLLASAAFRLYVSNFASYDGMYGGLGAAIVLQLWLFIAAWTTLLGGAVNDALDERVRDNGSRRRRHQLPGGTVKPDHSADTTS